MRAFGFIAAFAAFTSVFAAPLPAPANSGSGGMAVVARDIPSVSVPVHPGPIPVYVNVAGIVVDTKISVDAFVDNVNHVLAQVEKTVESKLDIIMPLLENVAILLKDAAAEAALATVDNVVETGESTAALTLAQVAELLEAVNGAVTGVLVQVVALAGNEHAVVIGLAQSIVTALCLLNEGVVAVTGDLGLPLISSLIAPLTVVGVHA